MIDTGCSRLIDILILIIRIIGIISIIIGYIDIFIINEILSFIIGMISNQHRWYYESAHYTVGQFNNSWYFG